MSTTTLHVIRCDRCSHEETTEHAGLPDGWAHAKAVEAQGRAQIGPASGHADLCSGCRESLFCWWREPNGPTAQPSPPPPAAALKPTLSLEARKQAGDLAAGQLRQQVDQAIAALRERPTAILHPEDLPPAFFGIEERAQAIVAIVAARLGVEQPKRKRAA